jgi:probable HAF family extracellular repeat protein
VKTRSYSLILITTLFFALTISAPVLAQAQQHHRYKLVVIGTFGGPNSYPFGEDAIALSNRGAVDGQADTGVPDPNFGNFNPYVGQNPFLQHAFKWQNGTLTDLGALPGPNTSNAGWITDGGVVSGLSTRSTLDPLTGWPEEAAILWKDGQIIDLGTLGGYEAQAVANNSRGQVAGFSSNTVPDSFPSPIAPFCFSGCLPTYQVQQRAFLWEKGIMQDLGTLGGPDAAALLINERGQVAGQSYISSTPNLATGVPTVDPFLWDNGKMIDLGSFGGTFGGLGWVNSRGQVVGSSNLPGDTTSHPFLWDRGVLTDLGTLGGSFGTAIHANDAGEVVGYATNQGDQAVFGFLWKNGVMTALMPVDGDQCSLGEHINSRGEIVGISSSGCSFSPGDGRAVLWETDGSMIDLNVFVPPGLGLTLFEPVYINDRGEITGKGPVANGDLRAFLLIPCGAGENGCIDAAPTPAVADSKVVPKTMTAEQLATVKESIAQMRARTAGRNRSGLWPRK